MIDVQLNVRVDQFNECMDQMARMRQGSATKREIIRNEVRAVLQKTVETVKVSNEAKIRASQESHTWMTLDSKRYYLLNRYPNELWSKMKDKTRKAEATRIQSIGWGARAWFELAVSLGLSINGGRAETAKIAGKDARTYVSSTQEDTGDSFGITVRNASRLQAWINGRAAFFSAIAGRLGFYRQNLKHGVFSDLKAVAAKYPGMKVTSD